MSDSETDSSSSPSSKSEHTSSSSDTNCNSSSEASDSDERLSTNSMETESSKGDEERQDIDDAMTDGEATAESERASVVESDLSLVVQSPGCNAAENLTPLPVNNLLRPCGIEAERMARNLVKDVDSLIALLPGIPGSFDQKLPSLRSAMGVDESTLLRGEAACMNMVMSSLCSLKNTLWKSKACSKAPRNLRRATVLADLAKIVEDLLRVVAVERVIVMKNALMKAEKCTDKAMLASTRLVHFLSHREADMNTSDDDINIVLQAYASMQCTPKELKTMGLEGGVTKTVAASWLQPGQVQMVNSLIRIWRGLRYTSFPASRHLRWVLTAHDTGGLVDTRLDNLEALGHFIVDAWDLMAPTNKELEALKLKDGVTFQVAQEWLNNRLAMTHFNEWYTVRFLS